MNGHRHVNGHRSRLPEAVYSIVALLFNGRIPPARKVDHMGSRCEGKARSCCFGTKNKKIKSSVIFYVSLEAVHDGLAFGMGVSPLIRSM